jgi:hypothetical protein
MRMGQFQRCSEFLSRDLGFLVSDSARRRNIFRRTANTFSGGNTWYSRNSPTGGCSCRLVFMKRRPSLFTTDDTDETDGDAQPNGYQAT